MTFLVTDKFYDVLFKPVSNAAWQALSPPPTIPQGALSDAIVKETTIVVYVIDATFGIFAFPGGAVVSGGYEDSLIDTASAAYTDITLSAVDGNTARWAKDLTGTVYSFDSTASTVRSYAGGEITAFKAFLP